MEIHCRINFYVTNICFRDFIYDEHWHGEVDTNFNDYADFLNEYNRIFGSRRTVRERYPHLFVDDKKIFANEVRIERKKLSNDLMYLYPILKTVTSDTKEDPVDEIIDLIIVPYARM